MKSRIEHYPNGNGLPFKLTINRVGRFVHVRLKHTDIWIYW